ncbi:MAG: FAD-binding oxidoreductase [Chlorobiaceae bacterium]
MNMHGWGRYPVVEAKVYAPHTEREIKNLLLELPDSAFTPRGLGRSYGDSSLGERMISSRWLNHMLRFDHQTGVLHCEAGVSLGEILEVFVPQGWFLPVTPGTQYVTIGGAIASDVHGKNHHVAGCFCEHVEYINIVLDAERILRCSPGEHADLFYATCGGMGLTGFIYSAAIRLQPIKNSFIDQTTFKASNLEESLDLFTIHQDKPFSVAWIDCISKGNSLGRSLLMTGDHAQEGTLTCKKKKPLALPFDMPSMLLNRYSIQAFNTLYYNRIRARSVSDHIHYESFFYPLDGIGEWNRMYGKNGFTQYQFVIPKEAGREGMTAIMKSIVESGKGSFLAVLKAFGKQNKNLLSFPMEGYTLALDFKIEKDLFPLLERLDGMVLSYGGRIYMTKDSRMKADTIRKSYAGLERFEVIRNRYAVNKRFLSHQSRRLGVN